MNPGMDAAIKMHGLCKCRCGAHVMRNYSPGHDAKHVAQLVHFFEANCDKRPAYDRSTLYKNLIEQLPTEALKAKFRARIAKFAMTKYSNACRSLADPEAWFAYRLKGLLVSYPDPTYVETEAAITRALLAACGWDRARVGYKFS